MIGAIMQGAGALIGGVSGLFTANKQKKMANQYYKERMKNAYKESIYAKRNLALANQIANARMAGASQAEENILQNQANTVGAMERGASSGSQLLAGVAATQGQADQSLNDLAVAEAQAKQNSVGLQMQANNGMTDELRAVHADRISALEGKYNIRGAAMQNAHTGWNNVASGLMAAGAIARQNGWGSGNNAADAKFGSMPQANYTSYISR